MDYYSDKIPEPKIDAIINSILDRTDILTVFPNIGQKEEYLASINYEQLWTTSIHEAYPGHYVQGMYLRQVASPVRKSSAIAPGSVASPS